MASSTVFDLISVSLGKSLETIIIPNFVAVAVAVASEFGDEPPSKDSMKILFEGAFKKALSNPGNKVSTKSPKSPKSPKSSDKKEKMTPKPKVKKAPTPKPQWLSLNDMKEQLVDKKHFYCGFVADRGPNKGKFCGTILTEEHKNCGNLTNDGWTSHTPDEEFSIVGDGCKMRCKKCWTKGKNGCYRKEGAAEKMYSEEFKTQRKIVNDLPEVPEVPNDDIIEPTEEELIQAQKTNDEEEELEQMSDSDNEEDNEEKTEDILDGLLDNDGPIIDSI